MNHTEVNTNTILNKLKQCHIDLTQDQANKLLSYYMNLVEQNAVMNLTAITDFEEVLIRHFADSLAPLFLPNAAALFQKTDITILDIGTGAGFPGIPLAIAFPETKIILADSLQKRTRFLQKITDKLDFGHVTIVTDRAENIGKNPVYRESCDIVVSRAVADLRVLVEYALPLVKTGGAFIAWKGSGAGEEIRNALQAITILGGASPEEHTYFLPNVPGERSLLVIQKTGTTPEKYPRRAGIPYKRPLK